MTEFNILIERDEDGVYVSEVIELPGCHTQARTIDELMKRTKEAILLYLSCLTDKTPLKEKFLGLQKLEV
jgi:predicted RNase H-like HicB family nuclease